MNAREPRTIRLAEDRWATIRHVVEAVAIIAAGIWAFYSFIYQERIKPANEPASLSERISMERLGRDAHREIVRVNIAFRNSGKTEIDVAADAWNVWGSRYGTRDRSSSKTTAYRRIVTNAVPRLSRRLVATFAELRSAAIGGPPTHMVLEPDTENLLSAVVVVPRGEYDVLSAQVVAVPIKTPVRNKLHVAIVTERDGSSFLVPQHEDGIGEDDLDTDIALIP